MGYTLFKFGEDRVTISIEAVGDRKHMIAIGKLVDQMS